MLRMHRALHQMLENSHRKEERIKNHWKFTSAVKHNAAIGHAGALVGCLWAFNRDLGARLQVRRLLADA